MSELYALLFQCFPFSTCYVVLILAYTSLLGVVVASWLVHLPTQAVILVQSPEEAGLFVPTSTAMGSAEL